MNLEVVPQSLDDGVAEYETDMPVYLFLQAFEICIVVFNFFDLISIQLPLHKSELSLVLLFLDKVRLFELGFLDPDLLKQSLLLDIELVRVKVVDFLDVLDSEVGCVLH